MTTLDTVCEKLIKTYNTTIIDQMPPVLQQALYSNAFACSRDSYKQHEKDRTVLAELIHNHFTKKAAKQELTQNYIGGPCTLTGHWSDTHQKLIYIFGEAHADDTDCSKFLENYGYGRNEEQSGMPIETYLKKFDTPKSLNDISEYFNSMDGQEHLTKDFIRYTIQRNSQIFYNLGKTGYYGLIGNGGQKIYSIILFYTPYIPYM